jgi:(2Fe-2S) ferredoxin
MTQPAKRFVICRGQYCNMDKRADKLIARLEPILDELNGDSYPPRIRLDTANCLSMCGAGPNAILYPSGQTFNGLDEAKLLQLVEAYFK